jgi:hypothetical protein
MPSCKKCKARCFSDAVVELSAIPEQVLIEIEIEVDVDDCTSECTSYYDSCMASGNRAHKW